MQASAFCVWRTAPWRLRSVVGYTEILLIRHSQPAGAYRPNRTAAATGVKKPAQVVLAGSFQMLFFRTSAPKRN
jgi:hypothetical protein